MKAYRVTAYVNVGMEGMLRGWKPEHEVAVVGDYYMVLAGDPHAAAEKMFEVGNRMAEDGLGRTWPSDVRSLSVGDVVRVIDSETWDTTLLAVASMGFDEIVDLWDADLNVVPLAGTAATSRVR